MADRRRTPQSIIDAAARAAAAADRLGDAFSERVRRVWRTTERLLPGLLDDWTRVDPTRISPGASRSEMRALLRRAGFDAMAEGAYGPALDPVVSRMLALRRAAGFDAVLTPEMRLRLEALGAVYQLDLLVEGDVAARALWRAAIRGMFGGSDVPTLMAELTALIDRSESQIRTLYDTSVSILSRQVEALQAGDDAETVFAYLGPLDDVTRDFCRQHVGKVYTRAEIDALDNGQIGPVFLTGGGYNCRHIFQEVSRASELYPLAGTGERIPEVADQLEAA